jgi:hypothetical protein
MMSEPRQPASAAAVRKVALELAALERMTTSQLADKYLELYGEPTRSRNKDYLRKRLAWRVQELAEGGLSERALERIKELGDQLPERWRMRTASPAPAVTPPPRAIDPRLPPPGSVITRTYRGTAHSLVVKDDGFEYDGRHFASLSAIARHITGTAWNGHLFFGLRKKRPAQPDEAR